MPMPPRHGTLRSGKVVDSTDSGRGKALKPSARAHPQERRFTLHGVDISWFVPFLAYQARGRVSEGLIFLGVAIALDILTSVDVTLGTDSNGPYYFMTRFWQLRRRATRVAVPGASLTHWSSALFCSGFYLQGPTSSLHVGTKGNRTLKPIAELRASSGKPPSFSPNARSLFFNLPNIIVLVWSMIVVRDVVCWQAFVVTVSGLTGIAFSLGPLLFGVPFVRLSASPPP
jgi:hypothetical protein